MNPPAPTLTAISPNSGAQGATVPVTLTGRNFVSGATVSIANAGVSISNVRRASATRIAATFTIAANAPAGAAAVWVTTTGGASNAMTFRIDLPTPTLTSIAPTSGVQGTSVTVTLTGTNLTGATVNVLADIDVTTTTSTATSVTALFVIYPGAATGTRRVSITNALGTSNTVNFTITAPAPVIRLISPNALTRNTTTIVTITGLNLTPTTTVTVTPASRITVGQATFVSATEIRVSITVGRLASTGDRSLTVTAGGLTSNAVPLTIQ